MTKAQLIAALAMLPDDAEVCIVREAATPCNGIAGIKFVEVYTDEMDLIAGLDDEGKAILMPVYASIWDDAE